MPPSLQTLTDAARAQHLDLLGALHEGEDTVLLLGPLEPGFWAHVTSSVAFQSRAPDPLDRWSHEVISALAKRFGAKAVFPSDGPPYPPFISWALASGRAWVSPVGMLVHEHAGLFVSYRGALRVSGKVPLPPPSNAPCAQCTKPCTAACPVDALRASSYAVDDCKTHIKKTDSRSCRTLGCAARRACPVSQRYARLPEQSAFHMRAFLGE